MGVLKRLTNERTGEVLATEVGTASNPLTRAVGLLGRATVAPHEGLWIGGCGAVHTMFMRATIDLVFLDRKDVVLRVVPRVPPGRLSVSAARAVTVVELGAAEHDREIRPGDRLRLG